MIKSVPIILDHFDQGSDEWLKARVGRVTMSNASIFCAKGRGGEISQSALTYALDIASEKMSGVLSERYSSYDMKRGYILEPFAREAYEIQTGRKVKQVGLAYLDEKMDISASPDGLCEDRGIEIKCPLPKNHLKNILFDIDKKAMYQIQGNMLVLNMEKWDFISFCPYFEPYPIFIKTIERDEKICEEIFEKAKETAQQIDEFCKMEITEVSDKIKDLSRLAKEVIDDFFMKEPEIS